MNSAILILVLATGISGRGAALVEAQVTTDPAFEVASVHVHKGDLRALCQPTISGTLVALEGYNIRCLVMEAYNLKEDQVSLGSLPNHNTLEDVYYDVVARAPNDSPVSHDQVRKMLRTFLTDRFKLVIHRETKEMPVYALVTGKNGPKFTKSKTAGECSMHGSLATGGQRYAFSNCSIDQLVQNLSYLVGRPVIDKTGLTGTYDFTYIAAAYYRAPHEDDISPFTAVKELGLKLESQKAPVEIVVVDHVETPAEN